MTGWDIACVACDAGSSFALASVIIAISIGGDPRRRWVPVALVVMFVAGFASCSVEGRVCEVAERQDVQP